MKQTIFFDRYCISTAANKYTAIDTQSGENVDLQLIPLAAIGCYFF